jgi:hypothetical protein
MKAEFTALVRQLIAEQGRDALFNAIKCKAFLADYTKGEYLNERRLLLQVVEAGITSGIAKTGDLASYKLMAAKKLQDDYFLAPNVANGVVSMLAQVLRGDTTPPRPAAPPAPRPSPPPPVYAQAEDEIIFFKGSAMGGDRGMLKSNSKTWSVVTITNMGINCEGFLSGDSISIPYQSIIAIEKSGPLSLRIYFYLQKDVGVEEVSLQLQFSVFEIKKVIQVLKENNMIIQVP